MPVGIVSIEPVPSGEVRRNVSIRVPLVSVTVEPVSSAEVRRKGSVLPCVDGYANDRRQP